MKKKLGIILTTVIMIATCFVFVACGEETSNEPAGPSDPATYAVTYDLNGGTGTTPTESKKAAGAKFNLASATGITNGDKLFAGWNDGSKTYAAGAEYTMPDKAVTFTAQWTDNGQPPVTATYTVTYDLNGGTGTTPTESEKAAGAKFDLASATGITNGDKLFAGWNDGSKTYAAGAEYTMPDKAVTFTAQWTEEYVAPALDENGILVLNFSTNKGELLYVDSSDNERTANLTFTLDGKNLTVSVGGQTFNGTYENGIVYITIDFAGEVYRFGKFEEPEKVLPTLQFDANGGTGDAPVVSDDAFTYSESLGKYKFKLPKCTFVAPTGKAFLAWGINGDTNKYSAGSLYFANSGEKLVLKALWKDTAPEAITGTKFTGHCALPRKEINGVVFDGLVLTEVYVDSDNNKVFYTLANESTVKSSKMILTGNTYRPDIYGDDALYYEIEIKTISYYIVIKADMTKLSLCDSDDKLIENGEFSAEGGYVPPAGTEYTVTFDDNLGGDVQTQKVEAGKKVAKPQDPVHPDGKHFMYWRDDETGLEYEFDSAVTGNLNLSARYAWKLTFAAGEGSGTVDSIFATGMWQTLPSSDGLSCAGKTFAGWSDGETVYQSGDRYMPTKNVTFTAQWQEAVSSYTVEFIKSTKYSENRDAVGEIPTMPNKAQGEKIILPQNPFTLNGYKFIGWTVQEYDGFDSDMGQAIWTTVVIKNPGEEFTVGTKNIRIAATWEKDVPAQYTVIYKAGGHGMGNDVIENNVKAGAYTLKNYMFTADDFYMFIGWA